MIYTARLTNGTVGTIDSDTIDGQLITVRGRLEEILEENDHQPEPCGALIITAL